MKPAIPRKHQEAAVTPRSQARMAAVQALYQMELAGTDVTDVVAEFEMLYFSPRRAADSEASEPADEMTASLESADRVFFSDILHGVVRRQRDIDPIVHEQLAAGWRLVRVDAILRAILRAGTFELMERPDVPARVIINEYINVSHAFFDGDEPRVVNGVLDKIGRRLREKEFDRKKS